MSSGDRQLREPFRVHVLFDAPVKCPVSELFDGAAGRFPGLDWDLNAAGRPEIDSEAVTFAVDAGADEPVRGMTKIAGVPGPCPASWREALATSQMSFPNAAEVVARHTDHLSITVAAPRLDTSLAARFDAARRATCLGAVLAQLPQASAVYFPSSELLVRPAQWDVAAETAMRGEVPILEWIGLNATTFQWDGLLPEPITVATLGMAAFTGHEIVMPKVRLPMFEAAEWVGVSVRMLMESDHVFRDGDTLGFEGGDKPIRLRHVSEGQLGMRTPAWALFHDASLLDDVVHCGIPRERRVAQGGDDIMIGDWNALKKKLYCFVAGGY